MARLMAAMSAAILLATAWFATGALAQAPAPASKAPADAMTDPAMKRAEVLSFIGVKPGDRVADIIAGRFVRALSVAVGPKGKVYAVEPAEIVKAHPEVLGLLKGLTAQPEYANVEVSSPAIDSPSLPTGLDAVFIRQNYHDLHDKFMGPADVAAFNRNVFAALKPGGVFVVLDHAAAAGSRLRDTDTLHRIDPAAVKAEVAAAGFVFDGQSAMLANSTDDHTKNVFDPAVRGHTDQFLFRFRKPK
ncbi:MAG: methyltransferase [Pseudomonadota bacterium]